MSRYTLLEKIGEGGMGVVYRARQVDLSREVAIKFLCDKAGASSQETTRRFRREMEILIGLAHPNIVRIFDAGSMDNRLFFVMELLEASDLETLVTDQTALPLPKVCSILDQLLDALGYLHSRGIVHRDLKPSNVMVDDLGRVILTDFGLARDPDLTVITGTKEVLGTPRYMPPEVIRGGPFTLTGDLWSFGVMAYELICGQRAFPQQAIEQVLHAILHQDPPLVSTRREGLPFELTAFVHRFLEKDPTRRWSSVVEAREALDQVRTARRRAPLSVPVTVPTPSEVSGPRREYRPAAAAAAVAVAVLVLGASALFVFRRERPPSAVPAVQRPAVTVERVSIDRLAISFDTPIPSRWRLRVEGSAPSEESSDSIHHRFHVAIAPYATTPRIVLDGPGIEFVIRPPTPLVELITRLKSLVDGPAGLVEDLSTDRVFHQIVAKLRGWDRSVNIPRLRQLIAGQPGVLAPYDAFMHRLASAGELASGLAAIRPFVGSILQSPSTPPEVTRALLAALWPLDQVDGLAGVLGRPPVFDVEGGLKAALERQGTDAAPPGSWKTLFPDPGKPAMFLVPRDEFAGGLAGGILSGVYGADGKGRSHLSEGPRLSFVDRTPGWSGKRQYAFLVSFCGPLSYLKLTSPENGASLPVRLPNGFPEKGSNERWIVVTLRGALSTPCRWTVEHSRISRDTWRDYFIVEGIRVKEM